MSPEDHLTRNHSRRHFVFDLGAGFGSLALTSLLASECTATSPTSDSLKSNNNPMAAKAPMLPTKAKSCIFLFMFGGPSQVDLFDFKPELQKNDGKSIENEFRRGTKTKAPCKPVVVSSLSMVRAVNGVPMRFQTSQADR